MNVWCDTMFLICETIVMNYLIKESKLNSNCSFCDGAQETCVSIVAVCLDNGPNWKFVRLMGIVFHCH